MNDKPTMYVPATISTKDILILQEEYFLIYLFD